MESTTIARPYAHAAFAVASESDAVSEWSRFLHTLSAITQDESVALAITNPSISNKQLTAAIQEGFSDQLLEQQTNFVRLLVETRRLTLIDEMTRLFDLCQAQQEERVDVLIVSARDIDAAQLNDLHKALEEHLHKRVLLEQQTDARLIGGAKIYVGDQVIDGSYQEKLAQLATALVH